MRYLLLLIFLAVGCNTSQNQTEDDIQEIEKMSAERAIAFNEGDASGIAKHFSENGLLMAPDSETLSGQSAVEAYYQSIFDEFETSLDSYYEEVKVSGDLAFGRGLAEVQLVQKITGDTTFSTSKYLNILQKSENGQWVTTHDIWNTVE
jgi:uncharacterized protein (TIGR02246 family)